MELWAILRQKFTALTRRRELDRDLDDEMALHLALREQKLRDQGMSAGDARNAARRAFGNRVLMRETTREVWLFAWLEHLGQDLRFAGRSLRKSPVLAVVVILSLALGIGANTAIFSLMDAVMLRRLPVQDPQELVKVEMQAPSRTVPPGDYSFTNAIWEAVRDQQNVFSGVFATSEVQQMDLASGGAAQYIKGVFVSGAYFNTLGIRPAAGRLISTGDDQRGCPPVAVLSYGFWQAHFRGAESAVATTVLLRGHPFQIIGVTAPRFYGVEVGKNFDVAMPLCASAPFDKRNLDSRGRWWLQVIGRIQPGLSMDRAQSGLALISPRVMSATMPDEADVAFQKRFMSTKLIAAPAGTGISELRGAFRDPLRALMAIVVLVLIIACANIASLLLARMTARDKEIAIRKALGASRGRIMRQLVTESMLLSALGAAVGLLFARWGGTILVQSLSTGRDPIFLDLSLDHTVLGFSLGIALLTGLLMGMLPALDSTRVDLTEATKARTPGEGSRARYQAGRWIVAGQVALSLVLLVASGLLVRTFIKLLQTNVGFDAHNVLVVSAKRPWWAGDDAKIPLDRRNVTYDAIAAKLRAIPGVISVSRSFTEPLGDDNWVDEIQPDSAAAVIRGQNYFNYVAPQYFATMRTTLRAGRNFNPQDTQNSAPVAIVNEALANQYFGGVSAIGRRLRVSEWGNRPRPWITIVGIVENSKYRQVQEKILPTVYIPLAQAPQGAECDDFQVRTAVLPETLIPAALRAAAEISPELPVSFRTVEERVNDSVAQQRLVAMLAGFFGALALVLAMIGLYGVLSYTVTQRQVEFGIRMALGAQPDSILRLVMRDVALVLIVGLGAGIALSFAAVTVLQKLLFGLQARDPATMIGSVCLLAAAALLAGYLPARRATRVDPMIALRYE